MLAEAGYAVRVMSRQSAPQSLDSAHEWAQADLVSGDGLAEAVADVDVVVHAATSPQQSKGVDVQGTERLLDHVATADVALFVYVSIVGIDAWESSRFPYYRHKLAAEELVKVSDVPTAIQRATQFYTFLDGGLRKLRWMPIWPLPTDFRLQPLPTRAVADRLREVVDERPQGHLPDIGGPEVLNVRRLVDQWQGAQSIWRPVVRLPVPGKTATQVRDGAMTVPDGRRESVTWRDWLEQTANGGGYTGTSERAASQTESVD